MLESRKCPESTIRIIYNFHYYILLTLGFILIVTFVLFYRSLLIIIDALYKPGSYMKLNNLIYQMLTYNFHN